VNSGRFHLAPAFLWFIGVAELRNARTTKHICPAPLQAPQLVLVEPMALTFYGLIGALHVASTPDVVGKLSKVTCDSAAMLTVEFVIAAFFVGCLSHFARSEDDEYCQGPPSAKALSGH
jgi:hypothetical protein